MATPEITCLLSHKCSPETHDLGTAIQHLLASKDVELLIDPFRAGDDVETRMRSFDFDAFIFLLSPDSMASHFCQLELATAKFRRVPFFVVKMSGKIPTEFLSTFVLHLPALGDPKLETAIEGLATAIQKRVSFERDCKTLQSDPVLCEMHEVARRVALNADRTVLAEHLSRLSQVYSQVSDATTRYWIAIAIGRAGTPEAADILNSFPAEDHPYALQGVRDALELANPAEARNLKRK